MEPDTPSFRKHSLAPRKHNVQAHILPLIDENYFKEVSREFDEFQVNTHLCKLRCWYL